MAIDSIITNTKCSLVFFLISIEIFLRSSVRIIEVAER